MGSLSFQTNKRTEEEKDYDELPSLPFPPLVEQQPVYTLKGTPGIQSVRFLSENHCELWLAFAMPNAYDWMKSYTDNLYDLTLTHANGTIRHYSPIVLRAIHHCFSTKDPAILYAILFNFIAYVPEVRRWATREEWPESEKAKLKPLLPVGCEAACVQGIRGLCRQLAERRITMKQFNAFVFCILTTGCPDIGNRDWKMPPDPHANWAEELAKRKLDTVPDIDPIVLEVLAGRRARGGGRGGGSAALRRFANSRASAVPVKKNGGRGGGGKSKRGRGGKTL